jgi:hypothetical protein
VSATLVIGGVIAVMGAILLVNLLGAGDLVIRGVTSRYLGSLPPGYAASKRGFQVYAGLVIAIGLVFAGFGLAESAVALGTVVFAAGALAFVAFSILIVRGEIATYRALKRP